MMQWNNLKDELTFINEQTQYVLQLILHHCHGEFAANNLFNGIVWGSIRRYARGIEQNESKAAGYVRNV